MGASFTSQLQNTDDTASASRPARITSTGKSPISS
jgi:hypothetical protein